MRIRLGVYIIINHRIDCQKVFKNSIKFKSNMCIDNNEIILFFYFSFLFAIAMEPSTSIASFSSLLLPESQRPINQSIIGFI